MGLGDIHYVSGPPNSSHQKGMILLQKLSILKNRPYARDIAFLLLSLCGNAQPYLSLTTLGNPHISQNSFSPMFGLTVNPLNSTKSSIHNHALHTQTLDSNQVYDDNDFPIGPQKIFYHYMMSRAEYNFSSKIRGPFCPQKPTHHSQTSATLHLV